MSKADDIKARLQTANPDDIASKGAQFRRKMNPNDTTEMEAIWTEFNDKDRVMATIEELGDDEMLSDHAIVTIARVCQIVGIGSPKELGETKATVTVAAIAYAMGRYADRYHKAEMAKLAVKEEPTPPPAKPPKKEKTDGKTPPTDRKNP
jgi:hypothetical protein